MSDPSATAREFASGSEPWFREHLKLLVEHKTISPGRVDDRAILAGASAARDLMAEAGAQAELVATAGTPAILGHFGHERPRARVVVYNHFDVQPAEGIGWEQEDPFRFEIQPHPERGFLYRGRGTTDDKGPALCALRAASHIARLGVPIDVVLLWETEEEIGSPHFSDVLTTKRELLRPDLVIVSDTVWPSPDQPAMSTGLRGGLQVALRLRTARKPAHSGMTGGVARNPLRELCLLVAAIDAASFWKEDVVPPTESELRDFAASGFDPAYFKRAYALERLVTEDPVEMMLNLWARPTCEVIGIPGGYVGPGIKTAIPHEAELKLSFRLVPNQEPARLEQRLRAFVAQQNPDVEVEVLGYFGPYRVGASGSAHGAIASAMTEAFGRAPVMVREGGSIGAVPIMASQWAVPVHFLPLSLPDHGYHAPNECFDWRQARGGIEAYVRVFSKLAAA
jgi:acetylornithine deacetylase/succinyl-diaminopimelate desuccinylase-like protein